MANAAADEQAGANRRRDGADAQVHDQHEAEVHVAHADAAGDRQEDRREDQHGRRQIQEHAHDQQEDVHDQQQHIAVAGNAHEHLGDGRRDTRVGHDVGHDGGGRDQEQDRRAALHRVSQQVVEGLEVHLTIDDRQQAAVQAHDHAGLGRREDAAQDAAHDDDDRQQRRNRVDDDLERGVLFLDRGGLVALLEREVDGHRDDRDAQQRTGQIAAHEQRRDGDAAGGDGVKDQRTGRRNQNAGRRRADVDRSGVVRIIALVRLQRAHDGAHRRGRRNGGAGNRAEEHVRQHVGGRQIARHLAHQQARQTHQALGDAALVHDVAAQ